MQSILHSHPWLTLCTVALVLLIVLPLLACLALCYIASGESDVNGDPERDSLGDAEFERTKRSAAKTWREIEDRDFQNRMNAVEGNK